MTGTPGWAWAAAEGVILGLLAVDLAMSRGRSTMQLCTGEPTGEAGPVPEVIQTTRTGSVRAAPAFWPMLLIRVPTPSR
jgi:hypothetical protein